MWSDLEYKSHLFNSGLKRQNRRGSCKCALHSLGSSNVPFRTFSNGSDKNRPQTLCMEPHFPLNKVANKASRWAGKALYPGAVTVIVPQQRLEEARRGVVQLQRLAECGELLPAQRAHGIGVETVKKLLQPLLVVVLLLAVIHPTGQHPALDEKQGKRFEKRITRVKKEAKVPSGAAETPGKNTHKQGGSVKLASIWPRRLVHLRVGELFPEWLSLRHTAPVICASGFG